MFAAFFAAPGTSIVSARRLIYATAMALLPALLLVSCKQGSDKEAEKESLGRVAFQVEKNPVDTMILKRVTFFNQLVSNGKLRALKKGELRFLSSGALADIEVQNGTRVAAGQVLARLEPKEVKIRLHQAELRYKSMLLDLHETLITFGYRELKDTALLPPDRLAIAYTRSNYYSTLADLSLAKMAVENLELKAPFAGVVANLDAKPFERAPDPFCTIIDDEVFEVEFTVLESEIGTVKAGLPVLVAPFTDATEQFRGVITQVNPLVDERGQVLVRAEIRNNGKLMEGMNVKVLIEQAVPDMLVVPKSAVLIRDNFEVLFRYGPGGKAMWTYITVLKSNTTHHAVTANVNKQAELNEGDAVIISGNLNLAHDSEVEIKK